MSAFESMHNIILQATFIDLVVVAVAVDDDRFLNIVYSDYSCPAEFKTSVGSSICVPCFRFNCP